MAHVHSPLRYPGGKSSLLPAIASIMRENGLRRSHYAEPYAGGASLALSLLFSKNVSDIHLNDIDSGIWSFWHAVLNDKDRLVDQIYDCAVTVDEWQKQKAIYREADCQDPLKLGFATFFLNRTNRSGIIGSGGVIGGLKQEGNYLIDCRFNKSELIRRIERIHKYRSQIHLTKQDAQRFLSDLDQEIPKRSVFVIDPPYFEKGSSLYTNYYNKSDHESVSETINTLKNPWILTYDNCKEISDLYRSRRQFEFNIKYSAQRKRLGSELLICSKGLRMPEIDGFQLSRTPRYGRAA